MFEKLLATEEDQNSSLLSKIAMAMMLGMAVGYVLLRFRRPSQLNSVQYQFDENLNEIEITEPMIVSPTESQDSTAGKLDAESETIPMVEQKVDRLVQIKGIGPVFASRLNDAGVYTFSDLANTSPDKLREIVSSDVNAEDWINQAKVLESS